MSKEPGGGGKHGVACDRWQACTCHARGRGGAHGRSDQLVLQPSVLVVDASGVQKKGCACNSGSDQPRALRSQRTAAERRSTWRGKAVGAQTVQALPEQASRWEQMVRHGALVGRNDDTQEEPGIVDGDANNKVPSYAWKGIAQVREVKRAR